MSRLFLFWLLWMVIVVSAVQAQRNTPCGDREAGPGSARIASEDEPGESMVISGRVLRGADQEPVAEARVLAYQTDAEGYYSPGGMDESNARLCGVVLTDADGLYRFETVRPAHYATGGPAAHVHFQVTLPSGAAHRFTLNFEGDPRLNGKQAGERWDRIRPVARGAEHADAIGRVKRDFWIR